MESLREKTGSPVAGKRLFPLMAVVVFLAAGCDTTFQPPEENIETDKAITVSLAYDGNGAVAGTVPEAKIYDSGSLVTVAGNSGGLARPGYAFSSWNTKANGGGVKMAAGSTFKIGTSNLTLYAQWTPGPLILALNSAGAVWLSGDGSSWTGPYSTGLSVGNGLAHSKGLFVAVGQDGSNYGIATSADGVSWNKQNLGGTSAQLTRIAADASGAFVAAGYYGVTVETFTSQDGLSWTGPFATGIPNAVGPAWSGSAWFIASSNGSSWKKSTDGANWVGTGLGSTNLYQAYAVGSVGGRILLGGGAPGGTNKQVAISSDGGASFGSALAVGAAAGYVYSFVADETAGRILCLGNGESAQVNFSDDYGATWTSSSGTGSGSFKAAVKWKDGFLAGDSVGSIFASADGAAFTISGNAGSAEIRAMAYNGAP